MQPRSRRPGTVRPRNVRPVTVRLARWSATHAWRAVALWLVFVAACVLVGQLTHLREQNAVQGETGQSQQALRWQRAGHLTGADTEDVVVTARHGRLDTAAGRRAAREVRSRLAALPQVASVARPVTSKDGSTIAVEATLRHGAGVSALLDATAAVQKANPSVVVAQTGTKTLNRAVNDQVASDLSSASTFSLPVTLVILLVAFGAIVAAGVPVLLALSAVGSATGLSALVSHLIPDSGSTSSMILLLGMAVGVDYSLFYVKRARAERRAGHSTVDSVEIAAETSGHSVLVSGVAVVVAMLGMYVSGSVTFYSLATGSIMVVAVAVLGSLTVLPALLVLLGRRIDRPRVPMVWRWTAQQHDSRFWTRVLRPSLDRPARTLAIATAVLALLAIPALGMRLASDSVASLPGSIAAKATLDRLTAAFPAQNDTADVVVRAAPSDAPAVRDALVDLTGRTERSPLFVHTGRPMITVSSDRATADLRVVLPSDSESAAAREAVTTLRDRLAPDTVGRIAGARFAVGGDTADDMDTDALLSSRLPWVIAVVVGLTLLLTGFAFRSTLLAFATAGMNLLSAGAAFGVLVLVFQHHWADGLLGYTSTGHLINWVPLFTFAVLFGPSMDYHVFVINRVREQLALGMSMREAVRTGVGRSAGTVTSAALVMVSVFSIFASLHMVEMKELGLGLAVSVLVDAVVVRSVLLPSLLAACAGGMAGRPTSARVAPPRPQYPALPPAPAGAHALNAGTGFFI
ncbi:MMPL family transporter, partial [Jatrophihabitans endophyticus]|uniref:MMPL family transporter n=1 Tax=Jatrophihabitans endophyticus TaxID=1206085 RepID=UPI001A0A5F3D